MGTIMLAIKLGSSTTTIYKESEGFLLKEPSLVAITGSVKGKEVCAVGFDAKRLQGRTGADNVTSVVAPIYEGVITNSELASEMLKAFIAKVCPKKLFKPTIKALVCVPLGITLAEKVAFEKVCYSAGISNVILVPSIICSAVGKGIDISQTTASMIVGIGGGCTDIAVVGQNMLINGVNVGMGGTNIDKAIEQQILAKFNLIIGDNTAEKIKKERGSLYINDTNEIEITGQDSVSKESKSIVITAVDIYPAVEHYYSKIAESISSVLAICPPDVVADVTRKGIVFVGGDSKIIGLEKYFKTKLNISVVGSDDADDLDVLGAAELLENGELLKKVLINMWLLLILIKLLGKT